MSKNFITADGSPVGAVGQGTWYLGENPATRKAETEALQAGMEAGMNLLDTADMEELFRVPGGTACATDQVLYHLGSRGIEHDLLPLLRRHEMPVMAYCPLAQAGRLRRGLMAAPAVQQAARNHGATPAQILLAFLLDQPGVIPIPRSGNAAHTRQNAAAARIRLTEEERQALDRAFPAPAYKTPLDIV